MAFRITNPVVAARVEALAERTGLTKTEAVEMAVDAMLNDLPAATVRVFGVGSMPF
jgi:hypothetical protein